MLTVKHAVIGKSHKVLPSGFTCWQRSSGCRRSHQATVTSEAARPTFDEFMNASSNSISIVTNPKVLPVLRQTRRMHGIQRVKELEQKVQALEEAIKTDTLATNTLSYSEDELLAIYEDVLEVDVPQVTQQSNQAALEAIRQSVANEDIQLISAAHRRLCSDLQDQTPSRHQILARANEIVSRAETALQATRIDTDSAIKRPLPLGLLSIAECEALVRASLKANDNHAAEAILDLMERDHMSIPEEALNNTLKSYADSGQIQSTERILANFLNGPPSDVQRHLHVRAHLKALPSEILPTSALQVLHDYEAQNLPAPMRTYTSVITALLSRPSSLARAQAWDVFGHMRYVAHPTPDILLYTVMMRACASPVTTRYSSEPEKALDLWTEMTVDHKRQPTVGAYNAVILACARSGTKTYVNEAFRLARQMLDSHRDARGCTPFRPDKKTFCALLEGAKRLGDLGRARWILAEMVKGAPGAQGATLVDAEIDEEVMMHVFHAYAAYNVPRQPKLVHRGKANPSMSEPSSVSENTRETVQQTTSTPITADQGREDSPSFAHLPPQTRAGVIREVTVLFERILNDRKSKPSAASTTLLLMDKKFRNVEVTSRLLTSYLSVYYKHASLEEGQSLFWRLYEDHAVVRSVRAYVEALERCANAKRGTERDIALKFATELWAKWEEIEHSGSIDGRSLPARMIERAHSAMIRLLTITDQLDQAVSHLHSFASKYPPNNIRAPSPKSALQSTRTSLVGSRPLVRMTSAADVPDDYVPPLLSFRDVEVLHHRLIDEERTKDIKYVTWLCKAYEWALRIRRDETIKARPQSSSQDLVEQ